MMKLSNSGRKTIIDSWVRAYGLNNNKAVADAAAQFGQPFRAVLATKLRWTTIDKAFVEAVTRFI